MDFHGAVEGSRRSFRETDVANFSLPHQFRHCSDGFFDGRSWVDAMLIVEVDVVDAEAKQASFARTTNIVRLAIHAASVRICGIADDAELCGEHDLVALAFEGAANQFFILIRTVHVRRIEKVDTEIKGAVNSGDRFVIVAWAIKLRHAHAAEAES